MKYLMLEIHYDKNWYPVPGQRQDNKNLANFQNFAKSVTWNLMTLYLKKILISLIHSDLHLPRSWHRVHVCTVKILVWLSLEGSWYQPDAGSSCSRRKLWKIVTADAHFELLHRRGFPVFCLEINLDCSSLKLAEWHLNLIQIISNNFDILFVFEIEKGAFLPPTSLHTYSLIKDFFLNVLISQKALLIANFFDY